MSNNITPQDHSVQNDPQNEVKEEPVQIEPSTLNKVVHRFRLGWKRDKTDDRDKLYRVVHQAMKKVDLPPYILLNVNPVLNQGDLGSCAANALCQGLRLVDKKENEDDSLNSRLFVYYNARVIEGDVDEDNGCMIRDIFKALQQKGDVPESVWPYDIERFKEKAPASVYKAALKNKITKYHRIKNLQDAKVCLNSGFPFVFGVQVYHSFMYSPDTAKTGIVPMPDTKKEELLGGHAILALGYDDVKQWIIFQNSWGADWGDKEQGIGYLPYAYFSDKELTDDMWSWE